jgi:hypothetical protein
MQDNILKYLFEVSIMFYHLLITGIYQMFYPFVTNVYRASKPWFSSVYTLGE